MSNIVTIIADKIIDARKNKERSQNDCAPNRHDNKCCDKCKNYEWYYDKCEKFDCEVDGRHVCTYFEYNR